MVHEANQKAHPPDGDDLKDLNGMAKALIVSMAWSYADAVEKNKRILSQPETGDRSEKKIEE